MKPALLLAALALSGCVTTKYVTRSCITPAQLEQLKSAAPPKVRDKLTGKADEDVRILAGSNIRLRSYSDGLIEVLKVCAG